MNDLELSRQTSETTGAKIPSPLEQLLEAKALPSIEVATPIGSMQVFLAGPDELISRPIPNSSEWINALELLEEFTTNGIVADYLHQYGLDKGPTNSGNFDTVDSLKDKLHSSDVRPGRFVLTNYLVNAHNQLFMAYADVRYEQHQADGSWQMVERKVHFRPDSATTLVEIISESGNRYIMLNIAWKEGLGGVNYGEASAGSKDRGPEDAKKLALDEVNQEIGLTDEEIFRATVREVFINKTVSPGGYSERMSGYHLTLTLSDERIQQLLSQIHGVDANERIVNQLIAIELPEEPEILTTEYLSEFALAWEKVLAQTEDLKTYTLILKMCKDELFNISNRLAAKNVR